MSQSTGFYFLSDVSSRRILRVLTLFIYFILFQALILLQRPFLQFDFVIIFYLSFAALFAHHSGSIFLNANTAVPAKNGFFSYLADFLILIFFMRYFPYLSSFILVLQLFLLFVASFDLDLFELSMLGFVSSVGVSVINLTLHESGSMQSILSLALFNLSYASVIIISRQLKSEFFELQTDLSQTQKQFRSKDEFSKTVLENIPLGLAVFQNNSEVILQNSYLEQGLHLRSEELKKIIYGTEGGQAKRSFRAGEDVFFKTDANVRKVLNVDEARYFDTVANEDLSVYLIRDVTDIRELENQKRQSEKMAAVGGLAAGIAHEIRNPLAGISGSIQLLEQDMQDETQRKLMKIVLKEIDRLNNLITEFLDYAKPEKQPDQKVQLKNTVEEVLLFCKRHNDVTEDFEWDIQLSEAAILGFNDKLRQAFLNIVINGIQAMKTLPKARYQVRLATDTQFAILTFKDNGCGMSEETKKKMFEPFHTTKPKGTGLGLAITHKILELHKAQVSVQSELGVGTEITIKLPLIGGDQK